MSAEQKWNNSSAPQVGFGDEFEPENLTDTWPTSSQSPGVSPQPSPDSQLLEPPPQTTSETTAASLIEKKSPPCQQNLQPLTQNYQQSPFISQSNQPVKDNQQTSPDKRNFPFSDPQTYSKGEGIPSFNKSFPTGPNATQTRPRPSFAQQSPQKFHGRNISGLPPSSHPITQGSNPNQPMRPINPFPPQSGTQVRPLNNQQFISNQGARNPHVTNQPFRPKPPFQNPSSNHPHQRGQQLQPRHHAPNVSRPQQNPQPQNQNSSMKPSHSQPHQVRPNPQFPHPAPNQQYPPRPVLQSPQNAPSHPRFQAPGNQRPRMMAARIQQQGPNGGHGFQPQPNPNSTVRPSVSNINQQGNFRCVKINQTGSVVRPPGIRPDMPRPHIDHYGEFDDFDDENDEFYDEDEDDEDEDFEGGEMYSQQQNFQPPFDYQDNSDDSDGSEEDHILMEELIHCEDDERYEEIIQQLHDKGMTEEEIEEYKENYARHGYEGDMGFDDDEDDMDMDEDEEEEMVSSSSMAMPRSSNLTQQAPQNRFPLSNQPPATLSLDQAGNHPPLQTSSHQPFSAPGMQQVNQRPAPNIPRSVPRTPSTPSPQRKPLAAATSNNEIGQQSSQTSPYTHLQVQQPKPVVSNQQTIPSPRPGPAPPNMQPNITPKGSAGLISTTRMPSTVNSNSSQIGHSSAPGMNQTPPHNIHQSHTVPGTQSGNRGYFSGQQTSVAPGIRPQVRHTGPVQGHRFPNAQTHLSPAQGMQRMPTPSPQLRAALRPNKPPSDPFLARQTVLKMQESLDAEIMAKKRPSVQQNNTFPSQQSHQMAGNQRAPHPGSSPIVRHKLPPRTPIPHIPAPRSSTNFNEQQGFAGNPRFQEPVPDIRPRHPTPPPSQFGVSPGQPGNRFNSPLPPQSTNTSNSPLSPQQTITPAAGPRMPGPAPNQSQAPAPCQNPGQLQQHQVNQQGQHQQALQNTQKPESFNLGGLSEDKCIVKGCQRLVPNMLYQIRSPLNQTLVLARWNGEKFEDLGPNDEKQLQQAGVRTSLPIPPPKINEEHPAVSTAADTNSGNPTQPIPSNRSQQTQRNNEDANGSLSTYVKPLPEDNPEVKKTEEREEENEDDFVFKKPLNENEECFRVCKHCGYTSKNFKRCEGCRRIFHGEVKIHQRRKANAPEPMPTSSGINIMSQAKSISKLDGWTPDAEKRVDEQDFDTVEPKTPEKFYGSTYRRGRGRRPARAMMGRTRGGGMKGRMGSQPGGDEYDSSDSEDPFDKNFNGSNMDGQQGRKRVPRGRGKGQSARKRPKKLDEPVTVMISSDEDEPSSTSNNFIGIPPSQSPASSAGSGSPIFPSAPSEPTGAFGRFRRVRMEDEQGNSKLAKKMEQQALMPVGGMEDEDDDDDDEGDEPPTYQIEIRSVRVGSMRTKPEGPLFINMRGVCFRARSERTDELFECEIMSTEVEHVKYYGGQGQPVLFFLLTQESGVKLRSVFHMEEGGDEYLDPSSTDMKQKMVVIIIESLDYLPQDMRETLSLWAHINNAEDGEFIEELTEESSNDLLIQSAPPVLTADLEHHMVSFKKGYMKTQRSSTLMPRAPSSPQNRNDNEPDSTSSSPPQQTDLRRYFEGPPIRLLQYPPPPARGIAITTEDLFCLNEGEFLNDVIIDFYLQYLHEELLTEEMRNRTHIFSSFFYKRLTQKDRHSEKTEEDAKKSLPERRHARVKKWTKTVDLFSKDFIIVPINEHSHWYLAVICFPGLATPEVVPFIPNTSHKDEVDNDNNNPDGEQPQEDGAASEGPSNQQEQIVVKTVFGRQLDPQKCSKTDESNYSIGQKQPCILMFDSLLGPSRTPNVKMLRDYLQCEWNAKKSEPRMISKIVRGSTPKVPQQSNYSDCGVYLLQYVESFFEDPIADYQIPMKGLQGWFTEDLIVNKREDIHNLIMKLHRRYQEERGDPNILDIKYDSSPPPPHPWIPPPNHPALPPHHRPLPPQDHPWPEDLQDGQDIPNRRDGENRVDPLGMSMDSGDSSQSGSLPDAEELQNSTSKSNQNIAAVSNEENSSFSSKERDIPPPSFFDEPPCSEEDKKEESDNVVTKMEVDNQEDGKFSDVNNSNPLLSHDDQTTLPSHNNLENESSVVSPHIRHNEAQNMNSENEDVTSQDQEDGEKTDEENS